MLEGEMLEQLINVKLAMKKNLPKSKVREKFSVYSKAYDNLPEKTILNKIEHRDLFYDYMRYMAKSGDSEANEVYRNGGNIKH